jgi:hypothetical protein
VAWAGFDVVRCRHFRAAVSSEKRLADQWVGEVLTTFDDILEKRLAGNGFDVNGLCKFVQWDVTTLGPILDDMCAFFRRHVGRHLPPVLTTEDDIARASAGPAPSAPHPFPQSPSTDQIRNKANL